MENGDFRWGIMGLGRIAAQFAAGLESLPGHRLAGVASRSFDKALEFAHRHGGAQAFGGYEELAASECVDAIYIATPHPFHKDCALISIAGGKATLVEKPFALNRAQGEEMALAARRKGVFLMEAMWTRFNPAVVKAKELLDSGAIGQPRILQAGFGFRSEFDPESRLFNPALGGGALLDVGIYPVSLSSLVFGQPLSISASASLGESGVDEQCGLLLTHEKGALSMLIGAVRTQTEHDALILGTEGKLRIHAPFWNSKGVTLSARGKETLFDLSFCGNGYQFEAAEAAACIASGRLESEKMPISETLAIMGILDNARAQFGLRYPGE